MSKKGNKVIWLLPVGLIVLFAFLFQPCFSWEQKIEIKTEKGVEIVRNPKTPVPLPSGPSRLVLKEELIIGEEQEDYWFSVLTSIAVDDSGNIYTLDPKEVKIRVFDPRGTLLRTFGRKGEGPGEYRGPGSMKVTPDGNLVLYDVLAHRFTYLTLNGKLLKTVSTGKLPLGLIRIDSKGFIYQHKIGRFETVDELIKYDPKMNPIKKILSFEKTRKPRGVMTPYRVTFLFAIMKDDNLIWLLSSTYDINVVNPEGKTIRRIIKDHSPVEITDADKKRYLKERPTQAIRGVLIKYEFPRYYPAVARLVVDDQDRIYVRTYEKDSKGKIYHDVFDPEGRYFARFSLPEKEQVYVVKNNKLYCIISESEEGIPLAKRYSMKWK